MHLHHLRCRSKLDYARHGFRIFIMKILCGFLSLFISLASVFGAQSPNRPNILFIMSDDHAAHAISAYGSRVNQTPNLDRLANAGIRFERCFCVNSICSPSRATIITGKYSHLNGVPTFNRFDGSQPTVAKYLQAAGYYTGMLGKWHLGSVPTGFDYWCVLPGQGVYFDPAFLTPEGRRVIKGYATDIITDLAIDFLKNRPKDKPFFLMCHHKAPHRPWDPDEKHRAMFANKQIPEPPTLHDDYSTRSDAIRECTQKVFYDLTRRDLKLTPPAELQGPERNQWLNVKPTEVEVEIDGKTQKLMGDALKAWKYQRYLQDYLACIQSIDDNVGRLLDWLDQTRLATNTVVIYTSDQGFFLGDHGLYDKRFMYEASLICLPSIRISRRPLWTSRACPCPPTCRVAASCRSLRAKVPLIGARAFTTGTIMTPVTTIPAPTTASALPRTNSSIFGKRTNGRCTT
jgi:arylsulfatase A-like enzyme